MVPDRRPRGATLPITLLVCALLGILLVSLQYQGSAARQALVMTEARFQADVAAENALVLLQQGLSGDPVPGGPVVHDSDTGRKLDFRVGTDPFARFEPFDLRVEAEALVRPSGNFGGAVFRQPDLALLVGDEARNPETLEGRTVPTVPFAARANLRPRSGDGNLAAAAPRQFDAALQAGSPLGAWAPEGEISLLSARSWTNPRWKDLDDRADPVTKVSGVPVRLEARTKITVAEPMPYGEARVSNASGTVKVSGGALAAVGRLPHGGPEAASRLRDRLESAFVALQGRCYDKTGLIFGRPLSKPMDFLDLVGGKPLDNFFTYEQATNFWFLALPQVSIQGLLVDLKLHLPLQPDQVSSGSTAADLAKEGAAAGAQIWELDQQLEKNRQDTQALQALLQPLEQAKKALEAQRPAKQEARSNLERQLARLQEEKSDLDRRLSELQGRDPKPDQEIARLQRQSQAKEAEVDRARIALRGAAEELAALEREVLEKERELESKRSQAEGLRAQQQTLERRKQEQVDRIQQDARSFIEGYMGLEPDGVGPDRKAEKEVARKDSRYRSDLGQLGHAYARLLKKLFSAFIRAVEELFSDFPMIEVHIDLYFFSFDIKLPDLTRIPSWLAGLPRRLLNVVLNLAKNLVTQTVTLVHLGHGGPAIQLADSSVFLVDKTLTVPAGRTLRLQRNVQVNSNVWVQQGACLAVDGDLTLLGDPKEYAPVVGSLLRTGILFLEEGASVVVGGDLVANQLTVTAPGGKVKGITSAVLCRGSVRIRNGTKPGITVPDLVEYLSGSGAAPDILRTVIQEVAPNLAKIPSLGPFHVRKPYFATYPTAFRILVVPPVPVVYPTFEPSGTNVNNTLFQVLSYFYALHLNLTLGENFVPCSDFWRIGENRVPILPKALSGAVVGPMRGFADTIRNLLQPLGNLSERDLERIIDLNVHQVAQKFLTTHLPRLLTAVGTNMLVSIVAGDIAATVIRPLLEPILDTIFTADGFANSLGIIPEISGVSPAFRFIEDLSVTKDRLFLAETPGVLVYAARRLDIDGGQDIRFFGKTLRTAGPSMAAGLFVAGDVCDLQTDYTIGAAVSLRQDVKAKRLLYYPPFTSASLYMPRFMGAGGTGLTRLDSFWELSLQYRYGPDNDSGESFDIPQKQGWFPLTRSWSR